MKSHTATNAVALATLAREGFRPRGDLVLIAQADEEDGSEEVGMQWLVEARPDLRVDYALDEGGGERIPLADGGVVVPIGVGEKACLPGARDRARRGRARVDAAARPPTPCRGWRR